MGSCTTIRKAESNVTCSSTVNGLGAMTTQPIPTILIDGGNYVGLGVSSSHVILHYFVQIHSPS